MHAVEKLVVVADRVDLGLGMAQLVERLHLRRDARPGAAQVARDVGEMAVRLIFERRHTLDEYLDDVEVAGVADAELAVVLRE